MLPEPKFEGEIIYLDYVVKRKGFPRTTSDITHIRIRRKYKAVKYCNEKLKWIEVQDNL